MIRLVIAPLVAVSLLAPARLAFSQNIRPGWMRMADDPTKLSATRARECVMQAKNTQQGKRASSLNLDKVLVLTPDAARELAQHDGNIRLDGLSELSEECAVSLGQCGGNLSLNGLSSLSAKTADSISRPGRFLELNGLKGLPVDVAAALGRCGDRKYGGSLMLNGLSELSDEASGALMRNPVGWLKLDGLTAISDRTAMNLARCQSLLQLNGLSGLSDNAAESLGRSAVEHLELAGVRSLSDSAIDSLAHLKGVLILDGVTSLSPAAAQSFARHTHPLSLDGLTTVSPEAAAMIAGHKGSLTLDGIKTLSPKAAKALSNNADIKLPDRWETISEPDAQQLASSDNSRLTRTMPGEPAPTRGSKNLADALARVPRKGDDDDPGWRMQTLHRLVRLRNVDADSSPGRMLDAYRKGADRWENKDGTRWQMTEMGLPAFDWSKENAIPAWKSPLSDEVPFVDVHEEAEGVRVTLEPTPVADGFLCGISFLVIGNTPANDQAKGLDFLAGQVEVFGGKELQLETSPLMQPDTILDFWNSKKQVRYTISQWKDSASVGHITTRTYGPLLFEAIASEPDFILLENVKIELSPQFRAGCRSLCDQVLELRKKQGQGNPPVCRDLTGQ